MFVVTFPKSAGKNPLAFARKAKKAGADALEIRGDLTPCVKAFESPLPILLSPRGVPFSRFSGIKFEYLDLESNERIPSGLQRNVKIIRSFHAYRKTPSFSELRSLEKKLRAQNPWAIKIAVKVRSYADAKTLEDFRSSLPKGQRSIVLGMGVRAHLNRMLSPLRDALTYTYLDAGERAAAGQVPLSLYRIVKHCRHPRFFGLLGGLDVRSLSPLIHNTLFRRHHIDALYFLALTDDLDDAWKNLTALGVRGFSITSPWKRAVIGKLDRVGGGIPDILSLNTTVRRGDRWIGYPRDTEGLLNGYPFLGRARSATILGSGGVVPEVVRALRLAGVTDIRILARNVSARIALARSLGVGHGPIKAAAARPDVLICAIGADVAVPLAAARKGSHAIDLRYGRETKFLSAAAKAGYRIHDGLPMLLHQALAQFQLFTGVRPSAKDVHVLKRVLATIHKEAHR